MVLTKIGPRNIDLVKYLLNDSDFYHVTPFSNMYGEVGIYVSSDINDVQVLDNIVVEKTCLCPKCEIESLFLNYSYINDNYVAGGIYRHPNRIVNSSPPDKMAAISQTAFSDASSWMKILVFLLKFHWSLFVRVPLAITQRWFR